MECRICGNNRNNSEYQIQEMMFGYKDMFDYFKCSECGCLQIREVPEDLSKYYPNEYYSFKIEEGYSNQPIKSFLKKMRFKHYLGESNFIGSILKKIMGSPQLEWIKHASLSQESRILDVGCGAGQLLLSLKAYGFKNLMGIDPYIAKDIYYDDLLILKRTTAEVNEQFDFIMLHHSFEHMDNQLEEIINLYNILDPNGVLLIRIPIVSSYAWEEYKEKWVDLDAPRHFYLHTLESISIIAEKAGFVIDKTIFDSTDFQFWGSEQYLNNISLMDSKSYSQNPDLSIFSKKQIDTFKLLASELNETKRGDQACFYLKKR